jgi:hypothetical protein
MALGRRGRRRGRGWRRSGEQRRHRQRRRLRRSTFGGNHPRILLNAANLARIKSNFATVPVANGFRTWSNRAMGGEDVYGFLGQFAALLYQITGTTSYANFAVSFIDDKVAAEEALIARGMAPDIAFDSYLYVGDQIMDLALVYDWCFDFMTDAQRTRWGRSRTRRSGTSGTPSRRSGATPSTAGRAGRSTIPATTTTTRSSRRRSRWASRRRARIRWRRVAGHVPQHEAAEPAGSHLRA